MKNIDNSSISIELVFNNKYNLISSLNSLDKAILTKVFWENVFLSWIKIIGSEFSKYVPSALINKKSFSLSFAIIDNKEITGLNKEWMHKEGATDVLSFPMIDPKVAYDNLSFVELGDIFISLDMVIKQSLEYNNTIQKEILWLASHGFLHLLGWDHKDQKELDNMMNLQEYLINKLNIKY